MSASLRPWLPACSLCCIYGGDASLRRAVSRTLSQDTSRFAPQCCLPASSENKLKGKQKHKSVTVQLSEGGGGGTKLPFLVECWDTCLIDFLPICRDHKLIQFIHGPVWLLLNIWDMIRKPWATEIFVHTPPVLVDQPRHSMPSFQHLIVLCSVLGFLQTEPSFGVIDEKLGSAIPVSTERRPSVALTASRNDVEGDAFLDFAQVVTSSKAKSLLKDIQALEDETGWKLRVVTKSVSFPSPSGKELKELWKPDARTVIVIENLSSPNILNFNAGTLVVMKLPRQFFLELQSRYGNQFFVQQEGEGTALVSTVQAIQECLRRAEGCKNVPGLTNDLYYLTLATSIAGGCVFGFAARLPPQGRVEASWQWVAFLSPLWLLLFVSFGVLPVVGRTSELTPLIKNALGFAGGAAAIYLTPIFGPSPISKK